MSTPSPPRRPDASMTLLREMMERPLDPGYAAAADRRERSGLSPSTDGRSPLMLVAGLVIGLMLSISALTLNREAPAVASTRATLIERIESRRSLADQRSAQIASLQSEITRAEASGGTGLADRLRILEDQNGALPVRGPGLVVTVDDAPRDDDGSADGDPRTGGDPNAGRVLARDIQIITNSMWEAGAEAVAINGQRLSSRSAIRFAGNAVLVNFRPLNRPYVISSIGDPDRLPTDFAAGSGGTYLATLKNNFGIVVDTATPDAVSLPGATSLTVREARSATSSAPSTTPSPGPSTASGPLSVGGTPSTSPTEEAPS